MVNPGNRGDGGLRRYVVHAAHEGRERGRVVRAPNFREAALAYAEAWRPMPDPDGAVRLVVTDLDTGERQEAAVDVVRPGIADLQMRRVGLEAQAAQRAEAPPGAERFAIGPIVRPERPPRRPAGTRDLRRSLTNAAAILAVALVAGPLIVLLARERSRPPWVEAEAPAPAPAAEPDATQLRAAVLTPSPAEPAAAEPSAALAPPAPRPSPRGTAPVPPSTADGFLTLPPPEVTPAPLELPDTGAEAAPGPAEPSLPSPAETPLEIPPPPAP